jgi:predicted ATPase
MLLGREHEQRQIEIALAGARSGTSAALLLVGEPGIGKTALLDHAASRAEGMQVLRARGIESEAQIPFASLFELIRPALDALERIPAPQAAALDPSRGASGATERLDRRVRSDAHFRQRAEVLIWLALLGTRRLPTTSCCCRGTGPALRPPTE